MILVCIFNSIFVLSTPQTFATNVDTSEDFTRSIMGIMEDGQSPPKESILSLDKVINSDYPNLSLTNIVSANTLETEL